MTDALAGQLESWRKDPSEARTVELCIALLGTGRSKLVAEVGRTAAIKHASNPSVLLAVGRAYVDVGMLGDAQGLLVSAGKLDPKNADIYRVLGEVLLRRGDAARALKVLERAAALGKNDAETHLWTDRAKVYVGLQEKSGEKAVAAEIARALGASMRPPAAPPPARKPSVAPPPAAAPRRAVTRLGIAPAPTAVPVARPPSASSAPPSPARRSSVPPPSAPSPPRGPFDSDESATVVKQIPLPPPPSMPQLAPPTPPPGSLRASSPALLADIAPVTGRTEQLPSFGSIARAPSDPHGLPTAVMSSHDIAAAQSRAVWSKSMPTLETPAPQLAAMAAASVPSDPDVSPVGAIDTPFSPHMIRSSAQAQADYEAAKLREAIQARAKADAEQQRLRASRHDASTIPAPGAPAAHLRDVLDALSLAGIYEPDGGAAPAWEAPPKAKTRHLGALVGLTLLAAALGGGGYAYARHVRLRDARQAAALVAEVSAMLDAGKSADLPSVESKLSRAFDLDANSPTSALAWVRDRFARALEVDGESQGLDSAIGRARQAGVPDEQLAFARVGSFVLQGDTAGAAALLPQWDVRAGKDAWFQLAAGAALERAGDVRAIERYQLAAGLAPKLAPAAVRLARAVTIELDPSKGAELAKAFRTTWPDRAEGAALVALAWARQPSRSDPPAEVDEAKKRRAELPISLRAVPEALDAIDAIGHDRPADATSAIGRALTYAQTPGLATWLGSLALERGDEATARRAALTAVQYSAIYAPARVLAARVALAGGRLDEALQATAELDASSESVALVRAAVAYERGDGDGLSRAFDALSAESKGSPALAALVQGASLLRGAGPHDAKALRALADPRTPWGDVVAIDAALDAGDLALAKELLDRWPDAKDRPLHALRLSRYLRYAGTPAEADAPSKLALEAGPPNVRTLLERIAALVATDDTDGARKLLAKNPVVLGPMASWVGAFIDAAGPKANEARAKVALLELPPDAAPLALKLDAALALAALKDRKRGPDLVKSLVAALPENPDVAKAATALKIPIKKAPPPRRR